MESSGAVWSGLGFWMCAVWCCLGFGVCAVWCGLVFGVCAVWCGLGFGVCALLCECETKSTRYVNLGAEFLNFKPYDTHTKSEVC